MSGASVVAGMGVGWRSEVVFSEPGEEEGVD